MDFYTIVIIIATCFLILCLIAVGLLMQSSNAATKFPPVQNPCPDGWMIKGQSCLIDGNTNIGYILDNTSSFNSMTYGLTNSNSGNTITNPLVGTTSINFNDKGWNRAGSSVCSQKKWANQFGIAWDGVSNNTGC
jgi:hypothetical protein